MKNLFYTSPKYLQNLKGLDSSASEIDESVLKTNSYVTPEMFGAVGDGVTDDTVAINNVLQNYKNILFSKTYKVNPVIGINFQSNSNIVFRGSKFISSASNQSTYKIINFEDVINVNTYGVIYVIGDRNIHIGSTGEWGMGVRIFGDCRNLRIDAIEVYDCWGDGLYIAGNNNSTRPQEIFINSVFCKNNRRQGTSIVACKNLHIGNMYGGYTNGTSPAAGLDIEPNETLCENITIMNAHFEYNDGDGLHFARVMPNSLINNVSILNLKCNNNSKNGVEAYKSSNVTIYNADITDNTLNGISFTRDINSFIVFKGDVSKNGQRGLSCVLSSQTNNSKDIQFYNTKFNNNSQDGSSKDGARVECQSGTLSNVNFYNCDFSDYQTTHTQRYGISSSPTNINGMMLDNSCTFSGNVIGSYILDSKFDLLFLGIQTKQNGSTSSRPVAAQVGEMFYDTTLLKPIWWNGTYWRDAAGTIV